MRKIGEKVARTEEKDDAKTVTLETMLMALSRN